MVLETKDRHVLPVREIPSIRNTSENLPPNYSIETRGTVERLYHESYQSLGRNMKKQQSTFAFQTSADSLRQDSGLPAVYEGS